MSVVIKDMTMPVRCEYCALGRYDTVMRTYTCCGTGRQLQEGGLSNTGCVMVPKPDWCPLVKLPEKHGRLIDADALIARRGDLAVDSENIVELSPGWTIPLESVIDIEPTVVEAEGEEGKK